MDHTKPLLKQPSTPFLWDLFCFASLIGIWPRFIEPNLILSTRISLKIPKLPAALNGFKILQISDLHINQNMPDTFIDRLIKKSRSEHPDLIALTGDFLCYSQLLEPERLLRLFRGLEAKYGCFAILGNHDYADCVSINSNGDYDLIGSHKSSLGRAFLRLKTSVKLTRATTERAKATPLHSELVSLMAKTPVQLLHNTTTTISVKNTKLNICGLGEYTLGRLLPKEAFQNYDSKYPGIILLHNPDGAPYLNEYPGNIILSGHTHGGQVNLPWIWKKFTLIENMQFKKGLVQLQDKWLYVNRGIGSILPFRWFSPPEMLLLTLESAP